MKILVTGAVDTSSNNATTLHLFSLADFWTRAGHTVRLVVPEPGTGVIAYPLEGKNLDIKTLVSANKWRLPNTVSALLHLPFILFSVWRDGFEVVYVRMSILSFILTGTVRLLTNAIVVTEHNGWVPDEGRLRGHPWFMQKLEYVFQTLDGRWAHLTRAVSPQTREKLIEAGCSPERVFVGENGTDLERMKPMKRDEALAIFNLRKDKNYIGFIGNLVYWQGIHILIDAVAICLKDRDDWEVLIAGDGIEKGSLETLAQDKGIYGKVHFLGGVALGDANAIVNCFDIAVAPFIWERNVATGCSPIKIRDYAGAGRAVVSSNIPAVADHSSTDWLMLHTADDPEHFAQCLLSLMDNASLRDQMGETARAFAMDHYSWDKVACVVIDQINGLKKQRN